MTAIAFSTCSEVLIVFSNFSKIIIPSFVAEIDSNISGISSIEVSYCNFSVLETEISQRPNLLAIFDITNNLNIEFEISNICKDNLLIHFLVSDSLPHKNKWTFSLSSSKEKLNEAFISILSFFNWTTGVAVSSVKEYSNSQTMLNSYSEKIELFSASSESFIQELVRKEWLRIGSSMFYLFTDKNISTDIQQALINSKILVNGTGILLIGESSYESTSEGALALVEKDRESIDSNEKYLSAVVSQMIYLLSNTSNLDDSLNLLSKKCENHYCVNDFSLLNIQKTQRKIVGSIIDGNLVLNNFSIVFPGNSMEVPKSQKKILYFSANDGIANPGSPPLQAVTLYKRGFSLALKDINDGIDILQNFELRLNDFDCGSTVYNATFCYNCINKDKNRLGLAHIVSVTSAMAYGEIATMAKLNITIPLIGAVNIDPGLSNSTKYPFYTRVSVPSNHAFKQIPLLLKVMGWESIAIIYQNESSSITGYYYISQGAEEQNINIVNKLKTIPFSLTRDSIKNYTNVFQEVIDTNVRLVMLIMSTTALDYSVELFYDLGMRKGDIFILNANPSWLSSVGNKDDYTFKRVEIAIPSLTVFQSLFVGEKGKKVHEDLYKAYGNLEPASWACLYYDSIYLVGSALDWAINQGNDYTNPSILRSAIRNVKFSGCTGNVYIQKNSNDPVWSSFTIQSNSYNTTTGIIKILDIGLFTPTKSQILSIKTPFIYADGTTNKPTDFRITRTNCPFDDILRQTFMKGQALVFGICFFIAIVTAVITFFIWKMWWNIEVMELIKREEISVSDIIVGATIIVEFFQILSMGPDIQPLSSFLADIGDAMSLDLKSFINLKNGNFWWIATLVIILCFLWAIFCIEILLHLDEKFNHIWFFRILGILADFSMPILGNLCFIPFISILLEIFVCDHSIGNNFTDSYLSMDCYQFCWQGDHIIYAVLSAISLICYEPFAVFCRPLWQEFQHSLHVKSIPLYLMVKTVVQVILIVMNKTLKRLSNILHGFVFTFLILAYMAFFLRFKAYNYGRFNWWHRLSLLGVAWVSCLCTINFLIEGSKVPWVALILGGWTALILIGLIVQKKKYPSLLFRREKDTSTLFKFAFTFGKKSRSLHSKIEPQKLDLFKQISYK